MCCRNAELQGQLRSLEADTGVSSASTSGLISNLQFSKITFEALCIVLLPIQTCDHTGEAHAQHLADQLSFKHTYRCMIWQASI